MAAGDVAAVFVERGHGGTLVGVVGQKPLNDRGEPGGEGLFCQYLVQVQ